MKTLAPVSLAIIAAGSLAAVCVPAPAIAMQSNSTVIHDDDRYDYDDDREYDRRRDRDYRDDDLYYRDGRYRNPRQIRRDDRMWQGEDGRYYCERDNGTTGLVIGAGVGALLGRSIDTRGDRTAGTLLGAIAGGLIGREIDRSELRCE